MQNSNDSAEPKTTTNTERAEDVVPILSEEEIKSIVKAFLIAWIRKDVQVHFPLATEIKWHYKFRGKKIDNELAYQRELSIKAKLERLISICAGQTKATSEEQKKATYELFTEIVNYRLGNRLDGKFLDYSSEDKLSKIEENIDALNKHFEELYFYVRTHVPDEKL